MDISIDNVGIKIDEFSNKYFGNNLKTDVAQNRNSTFEAMLQSAMSMVNETNGYIEQADEAVMSFALGLTNNTHTLQAAQSKANMSLQYTVAVRNAVIDAYKEIMQMQF